MSPDYYERSKKIIDGAQETLVNYETGVGEHKFLITQEQASVIGEAVIGRDLRAVNNMAIDGISTMIDAYDEITIQEAQPAWEAAIQSATGLSGDTFEFLKSAPHRAALNEALIISKNSLGLDMGSYIKFLETLLYADAPRVNKMDLRYRYSPRLRKGKHPLYSRSLVALDEMASSEPGLARIREKLIAREPGAVDDYLDRLAISHLAKHVLGTHMEIMDDPAQAEIMIDKVTAEIQSPTPAEEFESLTILSWDMLPEGDTPTLKGRIRQTIIDNAKTNVEQDWMDERLDLIFDIARIGSQTNRSPKIYVSNTFKSGLGLYVAVTLTHPQDPTMRIVAADNPLKKNALYFVDERQTAFDETGRQYPWKEVLLASKQEARRRGATRKYHTGNWVDAAYAVCEYQGHAPQRTSVPETTAENHEEISPMKRFTRALELAQKALANVDNIS